MYRASVKENKKMYTLFDQLNFTIHRHSLALTLAIALSLTLPSEMVEKLTLGQYLRDAGAYPGSENSTGTNRLITKRVAKLRHRKPTTRKTTLKIS